MKGWIRGSNLDLNFAPILYPHSLHVQGAGDTCAKHAARAMETAVCRSEDVPVSHPSTCVPYKNTNLRNFAEL